jgi:HEAT repeat protein
MGGAQAHAALAAAARSRDGKARAQAVAALVKAGAPEGVRLAGEALRAADPSLARAAATALANADSAEARATLRTALGATDPAVRATAIASLGESGDGEAVGALGAVVASGEAEARVEALGALTRIASPEATAIVIDAATHGTTSDERAAALLDLGALSDARAGATIRAALDDPDPAVAAAAVRASTALGDDVEAALLARFVDASAPADLRVAAATALRDRGGTMAQLHEPEIAALLGAESD